MTNIICIVITVDAGNEYKVRLFENDSSSAKPNNLPSYVPTLILISILIKLMRILLLIILPFNTWCLNANDYLGIPFLKFPDSLSYNVL